MYKQSMFNDYGFQWNHSTIHNYILVEVLQSAWTVFLDGLHEVGDLDSLIILQKKFVSDIIDKALLSDQQKELYKLL